MESPLHIKMGRHLSSAPKYFELPLGSHNAEGRIAEEKQEATLGSTNKFKHQGAYRDENVDREPEYFAST